MASIGRGSRGDDQDQYNWRDGEAWNAPVGHGAEQFVTAFVVRAKTQNGRTVTFWPNLRSAMFAVAATGDDPLVRRVTLCRCKVHAGHCRWSRIR